MPTVTKSVREFEGHWIDDGYELIGVGAENGWQAIGGWGSDGWDLGDWPYVIVLFRDREGIYERAVYLEGDIEITQWEDEAGRQASTDELAAFYWRAGGDGPPDLTPEGEPLPPRLRGPYTKWRCAECYRVLTPRERTFGEITHGDPAHTIRIEGR